MYSQSVRQPVNGQYIPPQVYDFPGYHHSVSGGVDASPTNWNPIFQTPREEYPYSFQGSSPGGPISFTCPEFSSLPLSTGGGSIPSYNFIPGQDSFTSRRKQPESLRQTVSGGKTRTKDKYRVVYTDHQRLELEKEFQYNHYITMRRKAELSVTLSLSERQVKIWFQNRRAKERKINKKKLQNLQQASTTTPNPPELDEHVEAHLSTNILPDIKSEEYKLDFIPKD